MTIRVILSINLWDNDNGAAIVYPLNIHKCVYYFVFTILCLWTRILVHCGFFSFFTVICAFKGRLGLTDLNCRYLHKNTSHSSLLTNSHVP